MKTTTAAAIFSAISTISAISAISAILLCSCLCACSAHKRIQSQYPLVPFTPASSASHGISGVPIAPQPIFPPTPVELATTSETIDISCNSIASLTPLILGKQVAKVAEMYICYVTNNSDESVMLGEGALLRRIPQLLPYDNATLSIALRQVVNTSVASRIIRILADPTQLFLLLGVGQIIKVSTSILTGFAAYNAEVPYIQQRLQGVELPIMQNYQSLIINGSLRVPAGDTVVTHIFGVPQSPVGPGYARASIPVKNAPLLRSIQ